MSTEALKKPAVIYSAAGVAIAGIAFVAGLTVGKNSPATGGGEGPTGSEPGLEVSSTKLPPAWPLHFCSVNVERNYPTSQAIPNAAHIKTVGGSVSIMAHPDSPVAQLRVIKLPSSMHAKPTAARALAESGAIQDGDVLVVFRKEWSRANAYGNLQLGQGHAALATVSQDEKGKIVQTVESPLDYSSHLDHPGHYGGHKTFQIIRPNLTAKQKANVAKWARRVLEKNQVMFQPDYGAPYFARVKGKDAPSLCTDLAMSTLYSEGEPIGTFCSELVWALLGLRNVDPDELLKAFPKNDAKGGPREHLASNVRPIFNPLPGATKNPLESPGLMQGPDVVLRRIFPDTIKRHEFLANTVLGPRKVTPTELDGIMSSGHQKTAIAFQPKIDQLRQWYSAQQEAPGQLNAVNAGINPNYSPTAFSIIANSDAKGQNGKALHYVGTVTFE
jgi:hypothetical protein